MLTFRAFLTTTRRYCQVEQGGEAQVGKPAAMTGSLRRGACPLSPEKLSLGGWEKEEKNK